MDNFAEIITPADCFDLITIYYARLALGLSSSADETLNEQLEMFIRWSSDEIATMCNRTFAREKLAETFRGLDDDNPRLWLSHCPVVSIDSVVEDGVTLDPSSYKLDKKTGRLLRLDDETWTGEVTVTYTGGYVLPYEAPEALQQASVLMIREAYYAATRGDQSIRMVSHRETRVIYFDPNAAALKAAGGAGGSPARRASENLLKKYTRFWV